TACFSCCSLQLIPGSAAGPRSPCGAGGCARATASVTAPTSATPATTINVRLNDCMFFISPPSPLFPIYLTCPPTCPTRPTCPTASVRPGGLLLHVVHDLLRGGEPDARLRLHVEDQLLVLRDARTVTGDVGMIGQHQHRPLAIGDVELVAVGLEDQLGRRQRPGALQVRRIDQDPFDRELDDAGGLAVGDQLVGLVEAHHAAVVEKPRLANLLHRP